MAADRELAASRQQLSELAQHLQTSVEQERAAIAREIHDDVGGALTALKFDLAWIGRHSTEPAVQQKVQSALEMAAHAIEASQRVMHNLRPAILELPAGVPLAAYRAVQEALTDVSKHAHASKVSIDLSLARGVLSVEVSDNGRGLRADDLTKTRSFGIRGLRERAVTVGGWVDISSGAGGTTMIVSVPVAARPAQRRHRLRRYWIRPRKPRPFRLGRPMIEVTLCDDDALIRRGIRDTLAEAVDVRVVGQAADYGELRSLMRTTRCDVLVLDIDMPGRSGLDALHVLKDEASPVKVLVVSMYAEDPYATRALRGGAYGYVNKGGDPQLIVQAVRTVAQGRKYVTPEIAQMLVESLTSPTAEHAHESLSDRELQTLTLIASGKRLSDIAADLTLSPKTVSVYRARVLQKLGLANNSELTVYAIRNGLVGE